MGWGALASVGTFAYGDQTSKNMELVERDLALPNWNADGFRIGLLTDPHLDSEEAVIRTKLAVGAVLAKKPDVLVWVGDYLTSAAPKNLENVRETLALMNETSIPSYGVLGNHDYWSRYFPLVRSAVTSSKMRLLRNETIEMDGVRICGVDDALMKKHRPDLVKGDRNTIVLLHEPDFVEDLAAGPSVTLSGHSHGGQICMPGGIALHTPRGAKKFVSGYYPDSHIPVYVSRGIGTTGPNWRLFCPPEATILTLRGA
ncbi:MAG: metallophosphoesterase [Chlorobia bacterium]|nr:metallophosphoesterase [Fimbriimonadaceae bacterium]